MQPAACGTMPVKVVGAPTEAATVVGVVEPAKPHDAPDAEPELAAGGLSLDPQLVNSTRSARAPTSLLSTPGSNRAGLGPSSSIPGELPTTHRAGEGDSDNHPSWVITEALQRTKPATTKEIYDMSIGPVEYLILG